MKIMKSEDDNSKKIIIYLNQYNNCTNNEHENKNFIEAVSYEK